MEDLFKTYKRNVALGINIDNLYYIYDRSSNNILEVSKYIYENLDYLSLFESSIENIFINKKLSANYFNQWIPKLNTLKQNIDNTLSELTLNITETCNFRCKYCFFNKKNRRIILQINVLKNSKKAVDFYFKNSNNCNHQISFIGGEPLLKFNLIKKIVEYIKTFNNKVSFTIITNGSLLKEDILNYLIENMFHITISFDGEKEIQGLNRLSKDKKNSFDIVYNNIRKIQLNNTRYFEQYVTINSVYSINITSSLSEFTNYLEAHFKNKFAINIQSSEINDEYTKFHNNFTKSFLSIYENIHIQGFENSSPPFIYNFQRLT